MIFSVVMTIKNPTFDKPIIQKDTIQSISISAALKKFNLPTRNICELKNSGSTSWVDQYGSTMILEIVHEAH